VFSPAVALFSFRLTSVTEILPATRSWRLVHGIASTEGYQSKHKVFSWWLGFPEDDRPRRGPRELSTHAHRNAQQKTWTNWSAGYSAWLLIETVFGVLHWQPLKLAGTHGNAWKNGACECRALLAQQKTWENESVERPTWRLAETWKNELLALKKNRAHAWSGVDIKRQCSAC
jgi:hypothetical protein